MSNFIYRDIKPIYRLLKNGDILNTETGELIEINPTNFYVRLLNKDGEIVKAKASSIFAKVILGDRSRTNKNLANEFYKRKFEQSNV